MDKHNIAKTSPIRSGERSTCFLCGAEIFGKCGKIRRWHWSHLPGTSKSCISREMSEWHFNWLQYCHDLGYLTDRKFGNKRPDAVVGEKDAVNEDGSIKPQGIDTSFLVATLTAAIQEMKTIIDTQALTITQLTARITALESA